MKRFVVWFKTRFSPLQQLLLIASFVRLFSVLFSKGFGWHDDHFLIIEASQSWVDGYDYNDWLPSPDAPDRQPSGHSLFYTGIHFFIFKFLTLIGITGPQAKMYVVRLLHVLWSLLIVKYGYKLAVRYGGEKTGWYAGLFLAVYWFMPFLSVRNLVEFVCIPPFLIAAWLLGKENKKWTDVVLAGLWMGICFSIRFQTIIMTGGLGLAMLLRRDKWKHLLLFGLACILTILITQETADLLIWKRPFAELRGYVEYNLGHSGDYGNNNWHMYFDVLLGMLIPPLSILLIAGFFVEWKKIPLLFWPTLLFFAFHQYFPNKQERFAITLIPPLVITGTVGMFELKERYAYRFKPGLLKFCKWFVIVLNCLLLPFLTVSYSKRHRVEAMSYLREHTNSAEFIVEDSNHGEYLMPPLYYYGRWIKVRGVTSEKPMSEIMARYNQDPKRPKPEYVLFWESENLETRKDSVKKYFPNMHYEATIQPSFIDKTLHWLNPLNSNQTTYIYKLN